MSKQQQKVFRYKPAHKLTVQQLTLLKIVEENPGISRHQAILAAGYHAYKNPNLRNFCYRYLEVVGIYDGAGNVQKFLLFPPNRSHKVIVCEQKTRDRSWYNRREKHSAAVEEALHERRAELRAMRESEESYA